MGGRILCIAIQPRLRYGQPIDIPGARMERGDNMGLLDQ
jgi:hypothetical protein